MAEKLPRIVKLAHLLEEYSKKPPVKSSGKAKLADICIEYAQLYSNTRVSYFNNPEDRQSFATVLAEDIYMRIFKKKPIHNMLGHTRLSIYNSLENWIKLYNPRGELAYKFKDSKYQPGVLSRCTSSESYLTADRVSILELLKNLFEDAHKFIRYNTHWSDSEAKLNAHTSFVMSIRNGYYTSYHLNTKDDALCRLMYNKFRLEFMKILSMTDKPVLSAEQLDQFMALQIRLDNGEITDEGR